MIDMSLINVFWNQSLHDLLNKDFLLYGNSPFLESFIA